MTEQVQISANVEYWVLKVLPRDKVAELTPAMLSELELVSAELCEPIDCYRSEFEATARALREHRRTGVVHKVTMVI